MSDKSQTSPRAPNCKVIVRNLGNGATEGDLWRAFSYFGPLRSIYAGQNNVAIVEFENPKDAENAARGMDGKILCGSRVCVTMSTGNEFRQIDPDDGKCEKRAPSAIKWYYSIRTVSPSRSRSRSPSKPCLPYTMKFVRGHHGSPSDSRHRSSTHSTTKDSPKPSGSKYESPPKPSGSKYESPPKPSGSKYESPPKPSGSNVQASPEPLSGSHVPAEVPVQEGPEPPSQGQLEPDGHADLCEGAANDGPNFNNRGRPSRPLSGSHVPAEMSVREGHEPPSQGQLEADGHFYQGEDSANRGHRFNNRGCPSRCRSRSRSRSPVCRDDMPNTSNNRPVIGSHVPAELSIGVGHEHSSEWRLVVDGPFSQGGDTVNTGHRSLNRERPRRTRSRACSRPRPPVRRDDVPNRSNNGPLPQPDVPVGLVIQGGHEEPNQGQPDPADPFYPGGDSVHIGRPGRLLHEPHVPAGLARAVRHGQPNEWQLFMADPFYGVGDYVHFGPHLNNRGRPRRRLHRPRVPARLARAVRREQPNQGQLDPADHIYLGGDNVNIRPRVNRERASRSRSRSRSPDRQNAMPRRSNN